MKFLMNNRLFFLLAVVAIGISLAYTSRTLSPHGTFAQWVFLALAGLGILIIIMDGKRDKFFTTETLFLSAVGTALSVAGTLISTLGDDTPWFTAAFGVCLTAHGLIFLLHLIGDGKDEEVYTH